jgi:hypothetical protein
MVPEPTNAQAFNRFMYCLGNPIRYNDPTGNESSTPGSDTPGAGLGNAFGYNSMFGYCMTPSTPATNTNSNNNSVSNDNAESGKAKGKSLSATAEATGPTMETVSESSNNYGGNDPRYQVATAPHQFFEWAGGKTNEEFNRCKKDGNYQGQAATSLLGLILFIGELTTPETPEDVDMIALGGVAGLEAGSSKGVVLKVERTLAQKLAKKVATVEENKLIHLFKEPKHEFDELLKKFGGDELDAAKAIIDEVQNLVQKQGKKDGLINVIVEIRGIKVQANGTVIDGQFRLGTASANMNHPSAQSLLRGN